MAAKEINDLYYTVLLSLEPTPREMLAPVDLESVSVVDLRATRDDLIVDLIRRAEIETRITISYPDLIFVTLPGPNGIRRQLVHDPTVVVKEDGALFWLGYPADYSQITVGDLERAIAEGFLDKDADPHCVIFTSPYGGNGHFPQTWTSLIEFLERIGGVYGGFLALRAAINSTLKALGNTQDKTKDDAIWLRDFFAKRHSQWKRRGATNPYFLLATILSRDQWSSSDVRRLFDIEPDEAEKLLSALGYEYRPTLRLHVASIEPKRVELRTRLMVDYMGWAPDWERELPPRLTHEGGD
jgi:hypothetical protein